MSAIERIALGTEGYAPANIPPDSAVVESTGRPSHRQMYLADAVRAVLKKRHALRGVGLPDLSLLDELKTPLRIGFFSYYLFMASIAIAIVAAISAFTTGWSWRTEGIYMAIGATCFILAALLTYRTDARFTNLCSEFWHRARPKLYRCLGYPGQVVLRKEQIGKED